MPRWSAGPSRVRGPRWPGPRTLLLQATHPVAFAGFFAHTGALDEPYERLRAHRAR